MIRTLGQEELKAKDIQLTILKLGLAFSETDFLCFAER